MNELNKWDILDMVKSYKVACRKGNLEEMAMLRNAIEDKVVEYGLWSWWASNGFLEV